MQGRWGANRRRVVLGAAATLCALSAIGYTAWSLNHRPGRLPSINGTRFRYATPDEARQLLSTADDYTRATSPWQRAVLMRTTPPVSPAAFLRSQGDAVQPWTPDQQQRFARALSTLSVSIERLRLPLPPSVLLVNTSGSDFDSTPYTRAHAIVLPSSVMDVQGYSDAEVLAHELFHVATRHAPALADRLYRLVGFEPVAPLAWPPMWEARRIANPDAPHHRHAIPLSVQGRRVWLMPVVLAKTEEAEPNLYTSMDIRLLEVNPGRDGSPTTPEMQGGEPAWHALDDVPQFLSRLGGNTDYVMHPEETVADNFMCLVSGRQVPNPGLLKRLEEALRETA